MTKNVYLCPGKVFPPGYALRSTLPGQRTSPSNTQSTYLGITIKTVNLFRATTIDSPACTDVPLARAPGLWRYRTCVLFRLFGAAAPGAGLDGGGFGAGCGG